MPTFFFYQAVIFIFKQKSGSFGLCHLGVHRLQQGHQGWNTTLSPAKNPMQQVNDTRHLDDQFLIWNL